MNSEGYKDPTADQAVHRSNRLPEPVWRVVRMVRDMTGFCHLDLVEITVRDRKSKRVYHWGGDIGGE